MHFVLFIIHLSNYLFIANTFSLVKFHRYLLFSPFRKIERCKIQPMGYFCRKLMHLYNKIIWDAQKALLYFSPKQECKWILLLVIYSVEKKKNIVLLIFFKEWYWTLQLWYDLFRIPIIERQILQIIFFFRENKKMFHLLIRHLDFKKVLLIINMESIKFWCPTPPQQISVYI